MPRRAQALLVVTLSATAASAADVRFDPSIEVGGVYSDNYTLERPSGPVLDVTGAFAEASLLLQGETPRATWRLDPRVRHFNFPDAEQIETTDFLLFGNGEIRNERSVFGVVAEYFDQDIAQSQLPGSNFGNADLGEGSGPNSGLILGDNRQRLARATPFADFQLTERTDLRVELNAADLSFDREIQDVQESFQSVGVVALLSREFTPTSRFGIRLDYQSVDLDSPLSSDATLAGAHVQWDYRVGERLTAYGRAGIRRSEFDPPSAVPAALGSSADETTPLYAVGARWRFRKSELFVDLQRLVDANATGFVVRRDDLRVYYTHRFSAKFAAYLSAYAISDESVTETGAYAPREYYTGSAGIEYRIWRSFSIRGEITRSNQEFEGEPETANSNSARVSVTYRPRRTD
jgi:hypothetical protein